MTLRELINDTLRTDADFDAFCVDNFPNIYCRFSSGMDRTQKTNLLLQIADHSEISEKLNNLTLGLIKPKFYYCKIAITRTCGMLLAILLLYYFLFHKTSIHQIIPSISPDESPSFEITILNPDITEKIITKIILDFHKSASFGEGSCFSLRPDEIFVIDSEMNIRIDSTRNGVFSGIFRKSNSLQRYQLTGNFRKYKCSEQRNFHVELDTDTLLRPGFSKIQVQLPSDFKVRSAHYAYLPDNLFANIPQEKHILPPKPKEFDSLDIVFFTGRVFKEEIKGHCSVLGSKDKEVNNE